MIAKKFQICSVVETLIIQSRHVNNKHSFKLIISFHTKCVFSENDISIFTWVLITKYKDVYNVHTRKSVYICMCVYIFLWM